MGAIALAPLLWLAIFVMLSTSDERMLHYANAAGNNSTINNSTSSTMQSMNHTANISNNMSATNLSSIDTFSAAGAISSLVYPNATIPSNATTTTPSASAQGNGTTKGNASSAPPPSSSSTMPTPASVLPAKTFILSGFWQLDVTNGKLSFFDARFTKVHLDATNRHTHEITNFTLTNNNSLVKLNANGTTTLNGTTGVALNNAVPWKNVKTTITINDLSTIIISLDPKDTSNHFMDQSIYGVVTIVKDKNGKDIVHFPDIIAR